MKATPPEERGFGRTLQAVLASPEPELLIGLFEGALEEPAIRRRAVNALLHLDRPAAYRLFLRGFHHLDAEERERLARRGAALLRAAEELAHTDSRPIRANVVEALGAVGSYRILALLLLFLDDPAPAIRDRAREIFEGLCERFVERGGAGRDALPLIRKGLLVSLRRSPPSRQAVRALLALGPDGHAALVSVLREASRSACDAIQDMLLEARDPGVVDALVAMITSSCEPARRIARRVFRDRRDAPFLGGVLKRLNDRQDRDLLLSLGILRTVCWEHLSPETIAQADEVVQERLLRMLEGVRSPTHAKARKLASFLRSRSPWIRRQALILLRDYPLMTYIEELKPLLNDPVEAVALAATEALQPGAGRDGYRLLILALRSPFESVRRAAMDRLAGRGVELALRYFDSMEPRTRTMVLRVLARVDREFFRFVRAELRSEDPARVIRALQILRTVDGERRAQDAIIDLTVDADGRVRATVARSLARLADEEARNFLLRFLRDPDPRVVANAVEAIADAGHREDREVLLPFLGHRNNRVRANTVEGLWRLGDRDHVGVLEAMLRDPDPRMRSSGRWAANRIGILTAPA